MKKMTEGGFNGNAPHRQSNSQLKNRNDAYVKPKDFRPKGVSAKQLGAAEGLNIKPVGNAGAPKKLFREDRVDYIR